MNRSVGEYSLSIAIERLLDTVVESGSGSALRLHSRDFGGLRPMRSLVLVTAVMCAVFLSARSTLSDPNPPTPGRRTRMPNFSKNGLNCKIRRTNCSKRRTNSSSARPNCSRKRARKTPQASSSRERRRGSASSTSGRYEETKKDSRIPSAVSWEGIHQEVRRGTQGHEVRAGRSKASVDGQTERFTDEQKKRLSLGPK